MLRRAGQRRLAVTMIGATIALSLLLLAAYDPAGRIVECKSCGETLSFSSAPPSYLLVGRRTSGYVFRNDTGVTGYQRYIVVFDAGSTGTRVHCFHFGGNFRDGSLKLEEELFEQIEPGLSSYAKDPKKAALSIIPLLDLVKRFVPRGYRAKTPVLLRATAGLRLLPDNVSGAILREIEAVISASPFLRVKGAVSILNGESEGLFAWLSVNFLRGSLGKHSSKTAGILDLGGGSVQIAVALNNNSSLEANEHIEIFNQRYNLFIKSYLGLGLLKARVSVLDATDTDLTDHVVTSPCLPRGSTGAWEHMQRTFQLQESFNDIPGYECYTKINSALFQQRSERTYVSRDQPMFAFSYFYDRAVDAQLVEHSTGGTVTVEDFEQESNGECETGCATVCTKPFACLDMSYISSLLQYGFGFKKTQKLILTNKIGAVEISWALGAGLWELLSHT